MFNKAGKFSGGFVKIYSPSITSPTASQIVSNRTPTISASSFSKYGNVSHLSTDWQVSDTSDFNTIRWESLNDSTNKTSIVASDLGGGDRYVRVRYKANNGTYSSWSAAVLFTSPWASGSNATLVSSTVMDVNTSTTVTLQPGTYRITIWGGGGGGAAGGGNGSRSGGGAGSVSRDILYSTTTNVTFTVGEGGGAATGSADSGTNSYGVGGSPGGGSGANGGGNSWNGGGGGGYSSVTLSGSEMRAAGGGGAGGDGGGNGGAGGSGTGNGGTASLQTDNNSLTESGVYHERSGGVNTVLSYTGSATVTHTNTFDYNWTFNTPYDNSSYSASASNNSAYTNITANGTTVPAGFYYVIDNKTSNGFRIRWYRNDDNSQVNVRYHTITCTGQRTTGNANSNGSPGSGGGGGGGSRTNPNQSTGTAGDGGSNSGTYSSSYSGSGTTPGNSYYSSTYSRTFGQGGGAPSAGQNGGARIEKITTEYTPVVSITSNISTTYNSTAGSSNNFSISATDTANNNSTVSYQWYLSTNGGSSYFAIPGENTNILSRYNPFYYSDNAHKIYCRATVTNTAGTNYADSNICTLNVGRNYDCNGSTVTGSVTISGGGLKPSGESSDQEWGSWSPGFSDICDINGSTNTFSAGGRCDIGCRIGGVYQGYQMQLELRIERSNGTRLHWGDQTKSNSNCGRTSSFQINANGGGWTPETDGTPTFRLMIIASGTNCLNGAGETIFAESDAATLNYSYKRRQYYYETRP